MLDNPSPSITDLFADMESDQSATSWQGTAERRIASNSPCDLFIGIKKPLNLRLLRAGFKSSVLPSPYTIPAFRALDVTEQMAGNGGQQRLTVTLCAPAPSFNDVFTSLAEDIVRHITVQASEREAAEAFLWRLLQWQRLLQKQTANGLTSEEQRGLWGELRCLRDFLVQRRGALDAVASWTGPDAASKDFQFSDGWAVEVKTSLSKQPQMLQIASERQLDDKGLTGLCLVHYSVEVHHGAGEMLPDLVNQIRTLIAGDGEAQLLFEDKLLDMGYFSAHVPLYQSTGYIWRGTKAYRVSDGFPRIIESDLAAGVGDVRYAISAASCEPYIVDLPAFEQIVTLS